MGFLDYAREWSRRRALYASRRPRAGSFGEAIRRANGEGRPGLVVEYKRCSPRGVIAAPTPWDYRGMTAGAADAYSVLTEPYWFCGSYELIPLFAETHPVLAKDFATTRYHVEEAAGWGASAILLVLDAVGWRRLSELYEYSRSLGLEVVIETSGYEDAVNAAHSYPDAIIGVNARDLDSLRVDVDRLVEVVERLRGSLPSSTLVMAESGVTSTATALRLARAGANALLIGTWIMREPSRALELRRALERSLS